MSCAPHTEPTSTAGTTRHHPAKVAFFAAMFAARPDVYAVRWDDTRSGRSSGVPAVSGGWRKGLPHAQREYLPLTDDVVTAHLSGELELGLYPLLDGDRCSWLAADFDGATMLDHQPIGRADDVLDRLHERMQLLGLRRMSLVVDATGDPEKTRHTVEQIGSRIPSLRPATAPS